MAKKTHHSSEQAQDAILNAAQNIIAQVGPAGLRLSTVAKHAGMAHPNVLHHFGSRDGLIQAVGERVGRRAAQRISDAIERAMVVPVNDKAGMLDAMTQVLDTAYPGDEGRVAVWLHLSGRKSYLKDNMQKVLRLSHQLRQSFDPNVQLQNTNRLVMLVTLALVGEVVSGKAVKSALEKANQSHLSAQDKQKTLSFNRWLAAFLLNLSDQELAINLPEDTV